MNHDEFCQYCESCRRKTGVPPSVNGGIQKAVRGVCAWCGLVPGGHLGPESDLFVVAGEDLVSLGRRFGFRAGDEGHSVRCSGADARVTGSHGGWRQAESAPHIRVLREGSARSRADSPRGEPWEGLELVAVLRRWQVAGSFVAGGFRNSGGWRPTPRAEASAIGFITRDHIGLALVARGKRTCTQIEGPAGIRGVRAD